MARIRGKDTKPEMVVRRALHQLGFRYRLHRPDLPGRPDIVFATRKTVLFVHGCFWHGHAGCKVANLPKSRQDYWQAKFERNKERDERNAALLKKAGWRVITVWECETKDLKELQQRLTGMLASTGATHERVGGHGRK